DAGRARTGGNEHDRDRARLRIDLESRSGSPVPPEGPAAGPRTGLDPEAKPPSVTGLRIHRPDLVGHHHPDGFRLQQPRSVQLPAVEEHDEETVEVDHRGAEAAAAGVERVLRLLLPASASHG